MPDEPWPNPENPPKVPESNEPLAFLRFIDPADKTKLMQLAVVDTGLTTLDGIKIYALQSSISGSSPGGGIPTILDKMYYQFVGSAVLKQLFSPYKNNLVWTESEEIMEASVPTVCQGQGMKPLRAYGPQGVPAGAVWDPGTDYISGGSRVTGALKHDFTDADPGELRLLMSPQPYLPLELAGPMTTVIVIPLKTSNNSSAPLGSDRVMFSLERTANYFKPMIANLSAVPKVIELSTNLGVF